MKKTLTSWVIIVALVTMGFMPQAAQAGDKQWARAGKIMTGVAVAGLIVGALASPPERREVVVHCPPPSPPRHFHHGPPPCVRVVPPPVRYVPPPVIVQPVPATVTVWVVNSNGSTTPVTLRRADNGMFVGPRGEYYQGLPTNEQLRQLYGM